MFVLPGAWAEDTQKSILFLSLNPKLDHQYRKELEERGYVVASGNLCHRIDADSIRRFNVIVIDQTYPSGNEYELFGQNTMFYKENLENVWAAMRDGAGVLVYPNLNDGGGSLAVGFNQEMKRFGLQIHQASAVDFERAVYSWQAYGDNAYTWTENVEQHPVTEGIKRIYYAGGNARWDDCYLTPPLAVDDKWTVLLRGMPGSMIAVSTDRQWTRIEGDAGMEEPVLAAVREVGKGRLAVFALSPQYIHRYGYTRIEKKAVGEQSVGIIDGIILDKGDGEVASDTGRFMFRLYDWLGENSVDGGLGGFTKNNEIVLLDTGEIKDYEPVLDLENMAMPPSWKHRATRVWRGSGRADYPELADPVVPGDVCFFRGLIGARTGLSDGKGTVAEYAAAARAAGYSMIAFTETFEKLSPSDYAGLVAECDKNTSDDLVCLPGFDIADPWGNRFLVIAAPFYPRKPWLMEDGKSLAHPAYINLCYGNHIVVAHRTTGGPTPNELLKHYQGFTVYTYRDGKLVEDASENYAWQGESASVPHPFAVHEIFSPAEVAVAAKTGYQQILPSDTPANAAGYFRIGLAHYFEGPSRYMLSEGPVAVTWVGLPKDAGAASENRDFMRVDIAVTNKTPLVSVELRDGFNVLRRWLPGSNVFSVTTFLRHSRQRSLYVTAQDESGRGMLTSVLRTVPWRYHFRCGDRQNWLGFVSAWYPGTHLPLALGLVISGISEAPLSGTPGQCMAPKLNYPFSSPDVVVLRAVLDETYLEATRGTTWGDARPAFPTKPAEAFTGTVTAYSFTGGRAARTVVSMVEYDLTLEQDLELPVNPDSLLLTIGNIRGTDKLLWMEKGKVVSSQLEKDAKVEIPVHGLAGGFIPLTSGFGINGRSFGLRASSVKDERLTAGSRIQGRFLVSSEGLGVTARYNQSFHVNETNWMTQMGFLGKLPYKLKTSSGRIEAPSFPPKVRDRNGILKGFVAEVCTNMYFNVPLEFSGLNPNWPVGIWQDGAERIAWTGVFEGRAWPRLDVGNPGAFIAGQLATASEDEVMIEVVAWTGDRVKLDVHNPTDQTMKLRVRTASVPGFKTLDQRVTLLPGTSVFLVEE